MKNAEKWSPSKYVLRKGMLIASRDPKEVRISSRLPVTLSAAFYHNAIPAHVSGRLLDLGCGKVPLYGAYRPYISESVCVDWEHSPHGVSHIDLACDLGERLPFSSDDFDTVILSSVLEHVPDPRHLWSEMERVLRPGGKALISVPFYYPIHEAPHDYFRFTEFALRFYAARNGFEVLEMRATGGVLEILSDILSKHIEPVRLIGPFLANLIQFCALGLTGHRLGKWLRKHSSSTFPFGYVMVVKKPEIVGAP